MKIMLFKTSVKPAVKDSTCVRVYVGVNMCLCICVCVCACDMFMSKQCEDAFSGWIILGTEKQRKHMVPMVPPALRVSLLSLLRQTWKYTGRLGPPRRCLCGPPLHRGAVLDKDLCKLRS